MASSKRACAQAVQDMATGRGLETARFQDLEVTHAINGMQSGNSANRDCAVARRTLRLCSVGILGCGIVTRSSLRDPAMITLPDGTVHSEFWGILGFCGKPEPVDLSPGYPSRYFCRSRRGSTIRFDNMHFTCRNRLWAILCRCSRSRSTTARRPVMSHRMARDS